MFYPFRWSIINDLKRKEKETFLIRGKIIIAVGREEDDETFLSLFRGWKKSSNPKGIDRLIYNAPDLLLSISTFKFQSLFLGPHLGQDEVAPSHQKATRPASFNFSFLPSFLPTFTWTPSPFSAYFPSPPPSPRVNILSTIRREDVSHWYLSVGTGNLHR